MSRRMSHVKAHVCGEQTRQFAHHGTELLQDCDSALCAHHLAKAIGARPRTQVRRISRGRHGTSVEDARLTRALQLVVTVRLVSLVVSPRCADAPVVFDVAPLQAPAGA